MFHLINEVYLVKEFAITITFQELTFIVNFCPFASTFGERSLSSISYFKH